MPDLSVKRGLLSRSALLLRNMFLLYLGDMKTRNGKFADQDVLHWYDLWNGAEAGLFFSSLDERLEFAQRLGRISENRSYYSIAAEVFDKLAQEALRVKTEIPNPPGVLITAGEFNRRCADLTKAEERFTHVIRLLQDEFLTQSRKAENQKIHRELGRVFYELAYLERLRGDAYCATSYLERSEIECDLGRDPVGASIARTLRGVISFEEGTPDVPVANIAKEQNLLLDLADDEGVKKAGRDGFARRWSANASIHMVQALLADRKITAAKAKLNNNRTDKATEPSAFGYATSQRIVAQVLLAEGRFPEALEAIGDSWNALAEQADLSLLEGGAYTVVVAGVINAAQGARGSASQCFNRAKALPAQLHNHIAIGLAFAGDAMLRAEEGDERAAIEAVIKGLAYVQRCGNPVRRGLLKFLRRFEENRVVDTKAWLSDLQLLAIGASVPAH
jgi:tetratricopeptide (TPR) repeat protein